MKGYDRLIDNIENVLDLEIQSIDSLEYIRDFLFLMIFP